MEVGILNDEEKSSIVWTVDDSNAGTFFWSIGITPGSTDILPDTQVGFAGARSASIDSAILYSGVTPIATLAEITAINQQKEVIIHMVTGFYLGDGAFASPGHILPLLENLVIHISMKV